MPTLTIDINKIVKAIADLEHGDSRLTPWLVAVPPVGEGETAEARVIWADTPSSMGGYFTNMRNEVNYSPFNFLDTSLGYDYSWGEFGSGSGPDGEWTEDDTNAAFNWISENLLDRVCLEDVWYDVVYMYNN